MEKPSFKEALQFWLKLGFISFGGPAGQVAIMHEYLVDKKKWISDKKFLHAYNYCMLLPGPEAQQLATYIGWLLHGTLGGLAAGILFVLPSMFILLGLSVLYVTYGNIPEIYAAFNGLKPAVIAIIILALIKIGKKSLHSFLHYVIAVSAFVAIYFFNIPFPYIIIAAVIIAIAVNRYFPALQAKSSSAKKNQEENEAGYYLNTISVIPNTGFSAKRLLLQSVAALLLWFLPLLLFYSFSNDFIFWKKLSLFFTQAALVTFGGAYAVLPYVAQVSVEKLQWLSNLQMIDGLALGETTPGPLIMVLAFVGFMAGYNHFGSSLLAGTLGLFTTTYFTFLPCFLFIFAGAPIIEKTQENPRIKKILELITAAVLGVVLNLSIYLAEAVLFPNGLSLQSFDYVAAIWVVISIIAMYRFNINMILWIGVSAIFGLMRFTVGL
jgi:chromate transporter